MITGSAGFIGRALTGRLHAAGHRVVAIDRAVDPSGETTVDGVPVLTADLLDGDPLVETALREADAVVHLAGCSGVRDTTPGIEHRRRRDNVHATRRVAELVPPDVPLLVTSSSSVYGGARFGRASRESDPLHPRGGYARSKVGAEEVCAQRAAAGGHVLVARPFTVVGEGQRPDMALSRWRAAALAGDPLRVFGSLERTRDFTCVREVARGLTALLDRGATGVVNVGSGAPRTLDEVVRALGAALGLDIAVEVEPAADIEVADTWADVRRFESLTGFRPSTDLADVVRRFVAALPRAGAPARADALLTAG
ncbi:MAG TPA: NAD(P)-dependent oxidoreductase [Nocardioidaceae bacterium]|nr:NAD(P)-dependent oxidoreductase [Nocardioidaceae bacterium]